MFLDGLFGGDPVGWLTSGVTGVPTRAGPLVNEFQSLTLPAVWRAVDTLGGLLGMLPLPVVKKTGENQRERQPNHRVHRILNVSPNPEMTPIVLRRTQFVHHALWGTAMQEVVSDGAGLSQEVWPILPHLAKLRRNDSGALEIEVRTPDGLFDKILPDTSVVRTVGLSYDGVQGLGLVRQMARENLGEQLAIAQHVQSWFGNGTMVGTVLTYPEGVQYERETRQEILSQFTGEHGGARQAYKAVLIDSGGKLERMVADNKAGQTLELRTFAVQDVARWLNIPPPFLMELSRATFSNITELGRWLVKFNLAPLFAVFEQAYTARLFTQAELDSGLSVKFMPDALLRGSPKERAEQHRIALASGWTTINEVRAKEDMNPIGAKGDVHMIPVNMQPLEQAIKEPEPEPVPAALAPQNVPEPGGANAPQDETQNVEAIKRSMMPVFVDAATRVLRKEQAAVTRAMGKMSGDKLDTWLDEFYIKHDLYIREALAPAADAMANCLGADVAWSANSVLIGYVDRHIVESHATLGDTSDWTVSRPASIAEHLTNAIADEVARQEVQNESAT